MNLRSSAMLRACTTLALLGGANAYVMPTVSRATAAATRRATRLSPMSMKARGAVSTNICTESSRRG